MGYKILVVDDAASMRMRSTKFLRENGFDVVEAENGAIAVEKYRQEKPDLVLMDVVMPEMDGISAVKKIREQDKSATIIMLSAIGQQSIIMEALQAGAKDYVVKPYTSDKVLSVIKKLLA